MTLLLKLSKNITFGAHLNTVPQKYIGLDKRKKSIYIYALFCNLIFVQIVKFNRIKRKLLDHMSVFSLNLERQNELH